MQWTKERCDYVVGGRKGFGRRVRPDGTTYSYPTIVGGERCTHPAVVTKRVDGKNVRRCTKHINASY
jgi:hypothetical protein